jgi:hypothetical protein
LGTTRIDFPVVEGQEGYPAEGSSCPICGQGPILEPHSFAHLTGEGMKWQEEDVFGPSEDLRGFLSLGWHGAHSGGVGLHPEVDAHLDIACSVEDGQFGLFFCSTDCLRKFLNQAVDELENRLEQAERER